MGLGKFDMRRRHQSRESEQAVGVAAASSQRVSHQHRDAFKALNLNEILRGGYRQSKGGA